MTLSLLFGFFSNLMLAYYAPEKTEQGIASFIGLKTPWQSREYLSAMRRYSGVKTMTDKSGDSICRCQVQRSGKFLFKRWRHPPGTGL